MRVPNQPFFRSAAKAAAESPLGPAGRSRRRNSLILIGLVAFLCACSPNANEPEPEAWVEIAGQRVATELADSASEQAKGLGYRDALAWDHGMYFTYARPAQYSFWMKGMRFAIDIIWIRQGRIVDLHPNVPFEPGGNGPTVRPREVVDAVLEVPAGYALAKGWSIGDRVTLERTAQVEAR